MIITTVFKILLKQVREICVVINRKIYTDIIWADKILKLKIQIVLVSYSLVFIIPLLLLSTLIRKSLTNSLFVVVDESYLTSSKSSQKADEIKVLYLCQPQNEINPLWQQLPQTRRGYHISFSIYDSVWGRLKGRSTVLWPHERNIFS